MNGPVGRVCLLLNPGAGSAGALDTLRDRLAAEGVEVRELKAGADLSEATARAAEEGFDVVAVAGGDGTVHAAAAGLLSASRRATLAVLPLGTGNDFCRTIAVPLDPLEALELLRTGTVREVDAARIEGGPGGVLVNAATGGFSGEVAAEVTSELKAAWGPLAYLRGAVGPITDPPRYQLTARFDGGPPQVISVTNVVVANARTAAGGYPVAPSADPEDGQLDVVLVHAADALDLTVVAARLMHGDYTHDENVTHRRAGRVELTSDPPLPMSLDGEPCVCDRVTFTVLPRALRVLTGPDYVATPDPLAAVEDEGEPDPPRPGTDRRLFGLLTAALLMVKRTPAWSALGLGLAAAVALAFGWVARGVPGQEWREWDQAVLLGQYASASPERDQLARALTWLGDAWGSALLVLGCAAGFLWRKHYLTAATFAAVVGGVLLLEVILKPAFGNARPELFPRTVEASGYSFPSGHALRGVGVFGFLAAVAAARGWGRRQYGWWLVSVICAGLAVGVCWSRVYLGVHWPTDVIAGGLAAAAWVASCLVARQYAMTRPRAGRVHAPVSPPAGVA